MTLTKYASTRAMREFVKREMPGYTPKSLSRANKTLHEEALSSGYNLEKEIQDIKQFITSAESKEGKLKKSDYRSGFVNMMNRSDNKKATVKDLNKYYSHKNVGIKDLIKKAALNKQNMGGALLGGLTGAIGAQAYDRDMDIENRAMLTLGGLAGGFFGGSNLRQLQKGIKRKEHELGNLMGNSDTARKKFISRKQGYIGDSPFRGLLKRNVNQMNDLKEEIAKNKMQTAGLRNAMPTRTILPVVAGLAAGATASGLEEAFFDKKDEIQRRVTRAKAMMQPAPRQEQLYQQRYN